MNIKKLKGLLRPLYYKFVHHHVEDTCRRTIKRYKKLYQKHKDQSCFIIANGPSLRVEDLELIAKKKIQTFAMNKIYSLYDRTSWRPTYYITQDPTLIRNDFKEICNSTNDSIVFEKSPGEKRYDMPRAIYFDMDYSRSWKGKKPGFSNGLNNKLFDGKTVTYSAIQLAVYMGFRNIYLLGCDCNYSKDNMSITPNSYADPRMYSPKSVGQLPDINYQFLSYSVARKYTESKGVNIYNATRGGMLEVFNRVDFDVVINQL